MTKKERIAALEAKVGDLQRAIANLESMMASFMATPHYGINYTIPAHPAYPTYLPPNEVYWQPKVTC